MDRASQQLFQLAIHRAALANLHRVFGNAWQRPCGAVSTLSVRPLGRLHRPAPPPRWAGLDVVEAESPPADPPSPRRAEEGSTRLRAPGPRGIILPVFTPSAGRRTALRERRRLSALGARLRTPLSSVSKTISALRSQIYGRGPRSPPRAAGYRCRTNR